MDSFWLASTSQTYLTDASSPSSSSSNAPPAAAPEKKKRKQNQACDACKTRRVKCDLADLSPGSSTCTRCDTKGIFCSSILNSNRQPAKRSGPRIEEAKALYGTADQSATTAIQIGGGAQQLVSQHHHPFSGSLQVFGAPGARMLPQTAISQAVERDLLEVYFRSAHFGVQAIDPVRFKEKYNAAGQLSQYMDEGSQVLCAIMCAWGARYTSNPYILPAEAAFLPAVEVGQTREPVCDTLLARAQTMMDTYGLLRNPTRESVEALILMAPLVEYKTETDNLRLRAVEGPPQAEETRILEGIMAQHVESLGLWEDATVVGYERSEKRGNAGELVEVDLTGEEIAQQMKSQRLLWCSWIWDSFRSAGGRKPPRFSDEAIFEICPHIPRLGNPLPNVAKLSDAQCFLLLVSSYPMVGELLRYAGKHITTPSVKKRNIQTIDEVEKYCRVFWRAMDDFAGWFDLIAARLLGIFPSLSTFSPISWYLSIKLAQTLAYLFVHRTIWERLVSERIKAEQHESPGFVESPSTNSSASTPVSTDGDPKPLSPVERMKAFDMESLELTLAAARGSARLISKLLDHDFMKAGGSELKELRIIASFLAEVPVVEQGFHGSRTTSRDWTWSNKVREVSWFLDGIERTGWGWGVNSVAAEMLRRTMVAQTPQGFPPFEFLRSQSRAPTTSSPDLSFEELYTATADDIHAVYTNSTFLAPNAPIDDENQTASARWSSLSSSPVDDASSSARLKGIDVPRQDFVAQPEFSLGRDGPNAKPSGLFNMLPPDDKRIPGWNPLKFKPPPVAAATAHSVSDESSSSSISTPFDPPSVNPFPRVHPFTEISPASLSLQDLLGGDAFALDHSNFSLENPTADDSAAPDSFSKTTASQGIKGMSVNQLEEFVFEMEGGIDWGATGSASNSNVASSSSGLVEGGGPSGPQQHQRHEPFMPQEPFFPLPDGSVQMDFEGMEMEQAFDGSFEDFLASFQTPSM